MNQKIEVLNHIQVVANEVLVPHSVGEIKEVLRNIKNGVFYFTYGSNMDSTRMKDRNVYFTSRIKATLQNYELVFNKKARDVIGKTFANVQQKENSCVEGIVYITNDLGITQLDKYEGFPTQYERIIVEVMTTTNQQVNAIAYIAREEVEGEGKPTKEYIDHLLAGRDLLSAEYIQKITSVETLD